jgi:threonine dehydratase
MNDVDIDPEQAAADVYAAMQPTAQHCWPLLSQRAGCEVWVKHENHTPVGSFKVRGGLAYLAQLKRRQPEIDGIVIATRGNHGQSIAFAARRHGMTATIVIPHGNSREKNAAMRALGGRLVEHGQDFQDAYGHARALAEDNGWYLLPSFHPWLVAGVSTYGRELLSAVPELDAVYVPVGLGSGICGTIAARDALGLKTRIYGVVTENAPAYLHSFRQRQPVSANSAGGIADGIDIRTPDPAALDIILRGAEDVIAVTEDEVKTAMRHYFTDTHNVAEGAAAAALAALLKRRPTAVRAGVVLSGGNVDREVYLEVLQRG